MAKDYENDWYYYSFTIPNGWSEYLPQTIEEFGLVSSMGYDEGFSIHKEFFKYPYIVLKSRRVNDLTSTAFIEQAEYYVEEISGENDRPKTEIKDFYQMNYKVSDEYILIDPVNHAIFHFNNYEDEEGRSVRKILGIFIGDEYATYMTGYSLADEFDRYLLSFKGAFESFRYRDDIRDRYIREGDDNREQYIRETIDLNAPPQVYKNDEYHFSFNIPVGWDEHLYGSGTTSILYKLEKFLGYPIIGGIIDSTGDFTLLPFIENVEYYVELSSKGHEEIQPEIKEFSQLDYDVFQDEIVIDTIKNAMFRYIGKRDSTEGQLRTLTGIFMGSESVVIIGIHSLADEFELSLPSFTMIVESFEFDDDYKYTINRKGIKSGNNDSATWITAVIIILVLFLVIWFLNKR
ncbi:MAG: hypothetical protein KAX05_00645 [Bacteroidales bacterium]|nr:hypothetical protein [Bacteroidales bacterium]